MTQNGSEELTVAQTGSEYENGSELPKTVENKSELLRMAENNSEKLTIAQNVSLWLRKNDDRPEPLTFSCTDKYKSLNVSLLECQLEMSIGLKYNQLKIFIWF